MASRSTKLAEWQQPAYQPYKFNHKADFGIPSSVTDDKTGISTVDFKKIATLHFIRRNQTISDRFLAAGTQYQDTLMIAIRHNKDLSSRDVLYAKLDNKLYQVINYSINDDTYNALDLLTLKHVKKVG